MKNRNLIIKSARRLDKFTLDDLIMVSELSEQEVNNVLSNLLKQQIVLRKGNTYFFNSKKQITLNNQASIETKDSPKQIIIEEQEGYDYFLTLNPDVQARIRSNVELINIIQQVGKNNLRQVIELHNQNTKHKKIVYSTFTKVLRQFDQYGFKGILPKYHGFSESPVPDELHTYFKKHYLTKEKLSANVALYKAQMQLQQEQKIEQPYTHSAATFLRKLKSEFTKEQIEYFRENIAPPRNKIVAINIDEPLDMTFQKAAKVYLNRLKAENQLEKLMHDKTNYNNHLKEYFDELTIREITAKIVAKYKQTMFDRGLSLNSVLAYLSLLKRIVRTVCPKTNNLIIRGDKTRLNAYALDMNILSEDKITDLLNLCKTKYPEAYPALYISLSTGASIPEILGLTWDRLDLENNTIFLKYFLYGDRLITNNCASSSRKLKIDSKITDILRTKFNKTNPTSTDFVFKFDSPKLPQEYFENVVLKGLANELGIKKLYPSDLQHNFVNLCLRQNIPITFIQKSLGYFGIANFVKTYKPLIEKLEEGNYNPIEKLLKKETI